MKRLKNEMRWVSNFFFRWKSKKTSTLRVKITLLAEPKIPTEFYLMDWYMLGKLNAVSSILILVAPYQFWVIQRESALIWLVNYCIGLILVGRNSCIFTQIYLDHSRFFVCVNLLRSSYKNKPTVVTKSKLQLYRILCSSNIFLCIYRKLERTLNLVST